MKTGKVSVLVIGRPASGKTAIMKVIGRALRALGFDVEENWGIDGPPAEMTQEAELKRLGSLANKSKVVLVEQQSSRGKLNDDPDNVRISVNYVTGVGFDVTVSLSGANLRHNFGDYDYSRERARAVAERLSHELGLDVIDNTTNMPMWRQSSNYNPNQGL